jgi:ribosome-associated protein
MDELQQRPPSKTQRKKAMHALQSLGETLLDLPAEQLDRLDLPEALHEAIVDAGRIRSREGRRRQLQYIGRLMRDAEVERIAERLALLQGESEAAKAEFHAIERWRARLPADDAALTEWLTSYPGSDAQLLRQLIRNARREATEGKPPRASRALFRLLRETRQT